MSLKLDAKIPDGPVAQKWDKHRFVLGRIAHRIRQRF